MAAIGGAAEMSGGRVIALLLVVLVTVLSSTFVVDEREQAILLFFSEIKRTDYRPGLHFKLPLLHQVRKFDRRLLELDAEAERFLTAEKKDVIVDSYVRWRIANVEKYYRATTGDERRAAQLLYQTINSKLRDEFSTRKVTEVVSGERGAIMSSVTRTANENADDLGIEVIDVRIKRIDLPAEVSGSVYARMRAERDRVARDFRSRGAEKAEETRANADRERTVILAEAYREAETIRGAGDALAAQTFANAYTADREFYNFYRSLGAYRRGLGGGNDIMVLKPESRLFRYFNDPGAGGGTAGER
jgi:membrane protease subunit HflC